MSAITKSTILNAIKKIDDKNFNKNSLTLNSIKKLEQEGESLTIDISIPQLNKETDFNHEKIVDAIKNDFPSLKEIHLNIQTRVSNVTTHKDPKKEAVLPGVKNTIAVASGKGGVGKSTVAVNLAVALAKDGASVGLIDADIYGPSIPLMLGVKEKPELIEDNGKARLIPLEAYGLKMISIGLLVDDNMPIIWRGPMASGAIKQFMTDVAWGELDYLVFDMPPGTGDIQLTLVQTIPLTGAVIVTTPQEVSLIDARKALKMFERVNVPVLGLIENMSYFIAPDTKTKYDIFGSGGGERVSKELGVPFLGGIPINTRIREGGDKGIPIVFDIPDSDESGIIMDISRNLSEQVNIRNSKSSGKVEILLGDDD
ncbi:MAG: iron-sulfur cluster carrier protein ApbC [Ignavibacteriaceae bacterium]|jgi:ATP-binding protein involved in chromosome partitioning|nr:iron-sulfur cluster carrier protein ApbC [Ignavibacteriaceae bacterium]MCW8813582.1 iron-sulfur cluster carrier protein ApbC [Chlorobium sp.]MCW8818026.1 iron-sulfur cluster carrier protein ApbC [Ignavibacteriaceae bacterium]MCW8960784.1 iron-sulfur cluster carrier protein ApbC [Ignavibacteriaceae bacterium]MCW9097629.1 iron-sulfur cluster carrier protein ApbC [Ignavibacteriaceae bacterium]